MTCEGFDLFAREQGRGPALVLLHGNGEDGSYFEHQLSHFSRQYRVIAPDTRGHGRSPRGSGLFTLEQFAEDLNGFLERRGLERITLLGFSDGANIAMLFALRYPGKVERLILNGGNLEPSGVKARVQLPICLGYAVVSLLSRFDAGAVEKRELLSLMVTQPHIDPAALGAISCPTLVIAGDRDLIKESHTRRIQEAIPGARLAILPGDHFLANRNSECFNQAVEAFLCERSY